MITATSINAALPKAVKAAVRLESLDWKEIVKDLDEQGNTVLAGILTPQECRTLANLYPNDEAFRSRVVMARYGFGRGEYKYSITHCRTSSRRCARNFMAGSLLWRTHGMRR